MKKIVIVGGAGFVGQNLVDFIEKDYEIIVIDKHKKNLKLLKYLHPSISIKHADVSEKGDWENAFENADCIVQLNAQIASPERDPFDKNNVDATKNILDVIKDKNVSYLIHISSAAVNSVRLDNYAETKKKGQELVEKRGVNYSILIPSMMYGPFDNKNVGWLINFMKKSPIFPIPGSGKYPRQPVYVKDFCNIIKYLIENKPKNEKYEIHGDKINFIDMVRTIRKETKLKRVIMKLHLGLFIFLMKSYNFILRKVEFTPDQVKSLTSGDVFEEFPWWEEFGVKKTSFAEGVRGMLKSKYKDLMLKR